MVSILVSGIIFILTVTGFVLLVRSRRFVGRLAGLTVSVLAVGFAADALAVMAVQSAGQHPLPLTALALYLSAAAALVAVSMTPLLGDESPSSKILLFVIRTGPASVRSIRKQLSDDDLVDKRLRDMVREGWITESKGSYRMLPKGRMIAAMISRYRRVLGWESGG
jgi:hypothetical protein